MKNVIKGLHRQRGMAEESREDKNIKGEGRTEDEGR
jgi:hypothetical protein